MLLLCFLNPLFTGGVVKVNGLALSVKSYGFASSPKVGALGSPRKVHLFAKASPFGRGGTAGDGEGEDAALAQQNLSPRTAKSSPLRESRKSRQALTERGIQEKFSAVVTSQISVQ